MSTSPTRHARPCWYCHYFAGMTGQNSAARCGRSGNYSAVRPNPESGCCGYVREPGVDDEDWSPPGMSPTELRDVAERGWQRQTVYVHHTPKRQGASGRP